jgi:hypothetical protein
MSIYDVILDDVNIVLQSLISKNNPEDYSNIARLIEILEIIRG